MQLSFPVLVMLCPFSLLTSQIHSVLPLAMAAIRENYLPEHVWFHKQMSP